MRYFAMVLAIGATAGALAAGAVAFVLWPDPEVVYQVEVIERVVHPKPQPTPVIDSLMDDGWEAESERQSDCLYDWLHEQVGYDITLDRVMAASVWLDSFGGPCEVMGR